jgi:hypothetical protein
LVKNLADDLDYEYINNENHLKIIKKVKTWIISLKILQFHCC